MVITFYTRTVLFCQQLYLFRWKPINMLKQQDVGCFLCFSSSSPLCMIFSCMCGFSESFHIWIIDVKEKTTGFAIGFVLPRVLLQTFKVKLLEHDRCAVAWWDWRVYSLCRSVQKILGQEGRRSAHASTRAKTRLGVRQNTGPLPLAASVQ